VRTFGEVGKGKVLCYLNSLMQLSVALNQDDFAKRFGIGSGGEWRLEITKKP
jgi:S-adenosylmethionine hydrolase